MTFDISTAMQLAATMTLIIGAGLRFAATGYPRALQAPIDLWIRGLLLQPPAFFMLALRGHIPDFFSIVLANSLLVLAFAHQMHALRVFNRQPDWRRALAALCVATVVGEVLLTYQWPSLQGRIALVSTVIGAVAAIGLAAIYQRGRRISRPEHLVALFLAAGIAIMFARIVAQPTSSAISLVTFSPLQGIVFTYASLLPVISTAAFMLMCGDRLNADLARLATLDPLTGVHNRRTMAEMAHRAIAEAKRQARPFALLALDVDHFKRINDEFGHEAGDLALCKLVDLIRSELRAGEMVSRIGGEEFVVTLPDTNEADARELAERIRHRIADSGFTFAGWPAPLRVSIGVGALGPNAADFEALLRATDRALYTAKRAGRNRVVTLSQIEVSALDATATALASAASRP